jgi:hypothetical protein
MSIGWKNIPSPTTKKQDGLPPRQAAQLPLREQKVQKNARTVEGNEVSSIAEGP